MCAKRLAEELNESFIEDYSTPTKNPEFWIVITNFLYLFTFYLLSQLVKIKTWELRPILELSPILELKPPSDVEIFIKARALITVNTVHRAA